MAVPKLVRDAEGVWRGKSQLNLSYLPPEERVSESPSELRIDAGAYATLAYTWAHGGEPQRGTMLVALDEETKAVQIGWADSWHQASAVMHLAGAETEDGAVRTKGTWPAGDETWGWTVDLDLKGDELTLGMDVITAEGESEWAVRATYTRV